MFLPTRLIHGRVKVYFEDYVDYAGNTKNIGNTEAQTETAPGVSGSSYSNPNSTTNVDTSADTSGYGGYSYGSSGGYDYEAAEQKAKEEAKELAERAASNLEGITGYNQQTILNAAEQSDKNYDIAEQQNLNLKNLENRQARRNAGDSWFSEQQNLQSTVKNLLDSAGNAANGSWLRDFWNTIARVDDMADAETLNTLRENLNSQDNEYWEALMQINNSRNDTYLETEQNLRELASDYAAQLNNLETIDTDLLGDMINSEDHTLNLPDWLNTTYYDEHARTAYEPDEVRFFRNNNAAQAASSLANVSSANLSQNTNSDYWSRLRSGYSRRTQ